MESGENPSQTWRLRGNIGWAADYRLCPFHRSTVQAYGALLSPIERRSGHPACRQKARRAAGREPSGLIRIGRVIRQSPSRARRMSPPSRHGRPSWRTRTSTSAMSRPEPRRMGRASFHRLSPWNTPYAPSEGASTSPGARQKRSPDRIATARMNSDRLRKGAS